VNIPAGDLGIWVEIHRERLTLAKAEVASALADLLFGPDAIAPIEVRALITEAVLEAAASRHVRQVLANRHVRHVIADVHDLVIAALRRTPHEPRKPRHPPRDLVQEFGVDGIVDRLFALILVIALAIVDRAMASASEDVRREFDDQADDA
jgi:hypothetical protein